MTQFGLAALLATAFAQSAPSAPKSQTAAGVVFEDLDGDGVRAPEEPGLPEVRVSNGRDIVRTGSDGRYAIEVTDDTIVFVIKPSDWRAPENARRIPQFFYRHKPAGSPVSKFPGVEPTGPLPASVDFPLRRSEEPARFRVLFFGDTQPRDQREIDYIAHDVVEEVVGIEAAFGVTLGDITFDDLSLFESLSRTLALVGVPWINVIGNHDMNYDSPDDRGSDETFERYFGPSYYAFDYAQVHFVVLDDVEWTGPREGRKGAYRGALGADQMRFLRNDLALTPSERLVVLMMRIPLYEVAEKAEIVAMLASRPRSFSIAAHQHFQEHVFLDAPAGSPASQPHHHLVNNTVCGSWWTGAPDEFGIPHTTMRDGAPNGYTIATFDGDRYDLRFKAARRPEDHQMSIFAPEVVKAVDAANTEVLVNVFAGSERSVVEMSWGDSGCWIRLERARVEDRYFAEMKKLEAGKTPPPGRKLPDLIKSAHIWRGVLPSDPAVGTHLIHVRTTDMFGRTYRDRRVIRIE